MGDFWNDLFQISLFLAILLWYIFAFFRRAKKARSSSSSSANTDTIDTDPNVNISKRPTETTEEENPFSFFFGPSNNVSTTETRTVSPPSNRFRENQENYIANQEDYERDQDDYEQDYTEESFSKLKTIQKNLPQKPPKQKKILKRRNPLFFSEKPLVQAIVISEVLGKPRSEKTDL